MSDSDNENLYALRQMVLSTVGGKEVVAFAEKWAREKSSVWPYGTCHPNDFPTMYEAGFYRGYLKGAASRIDPANDNPLE